MSYQLDAGSYASSSNDISPNHSATIGHKRVHSDMSSANNTENLNTLNLQPALIDTVPAVAQPYQYVSQQCSPNMKLAANILSSNVHRTAPSHNTTAPAQQAQLTPRRDNSAPSQLAVYNSVMSPMSMLLATSDYLATDKKDVKQEPQHTVKQHDTDSIASSTSHLLQHTGQSPVLHTTSLQPFNYLGNVRSLSAPTYDTLNDADPVLPQQPYSSHPLHNTQRTYHDTNLQPTTPPLHNGIMQQLNSDTPSMPQQHLSHMYSTSPLLSYNSGQSYVSHSTPSQSSSATPSIDETPYILMSDPKNKYGCVECNKQFPSKSSLHMHSLTHTGDKPFHCTYPDCSKSFRQKGHLVSHYRRHTGEKPFECSVCHNQFKDKSGLNTHIRKHHSADTGALEQLEHDCNAAPQQRTGKLKQRKCSTDTTSSDSRSTSVSPHRQPKGRKQATLPLKSVQPPTVQTQYADITAPVRAGTPPADFGAAFRAVSYNYSLPIDELPHTLPAHDNGTASFLQHSQMDAVSPQSVSMLLTSPVFHTSHQTSEPYNTLI